MIPGQTTLRQISIYKASPVTVFMGTGTFLQLLRKLEMSLKGPYPFRLCGVLMNWFAVLEQIQQDVFSDGTISGLSHETPPSVYSK